MNIELKNKYFLILVGAVVVFIYICMTEIAERFAEVVELYSQLRQKESTLLTPNKVDEQKRALALRSKELSQALFLGGQNYDQSPSGVVEFLGDCARESKLHFESLAPSPIKSGNGISELGFKISSRTRYNQVGKFVNEIESGALPVRLKKLELISKAPGASTIQLNLEASAFFFKN